MPACADLTDMILQVAVEDVEVSTTHSIKDHLPKSSVRLPAVGFDVATVCSHSFIVVGAFQSACEGEMVCKLNNPKVPFFNAPIYLQDKTMIGKIDEILGPLNEIFFTVKMQDGKTANTFKKDDKVYIGLDKLLPMDRFLPKPKVAGKGNV